MEEFFDKFKTHASKAKDEAAKLTKQMKNKTNSLIGQTKLSFAISETETKINDIYAELGKILYNSYKAGAPVSDEAAEACEKINSLMSELSDLNDKLSEMKDTVRCECGEYNKKNSQYCSKCGKKIGEVYSYAENFSDEEEEVVIINPVKPEADAE